jgi:hypothetical protein
MKLKFLLFMALLPVHGQTKVDAGTQAGGTQINGPSQMKNIAPVSTVQRWQCVGSGISRVAAGSGASATASVVSPTSLAFSLVSGGSSYVNPSATVTGGTGTSGNIFIYQTNGVITSLQAPNATGYTVGDVLTVTIVDNNSTWNCAGLQMIKIVLLDGTTLGPYINIPALPPMIANPDWQMMLINAPDPVVPNSLGSAK